MTGPASRATPAPAQDTRGILHPAQMRRHAVLNRYPPGPVLDGIVDWFWAVSWQLPAGAEHVQSVLSQPGANISIGTVDDVGATPDHPQGRVYGLHRGVSERRLRGAGWTVAAKSTVGGFGALVSLPARELTDRWATLDAALDLDGDELVRQVTACAAEAARVDLLRAALEGVLQRQDPCRVARARKLATVAARAERDPAVTRVEDLAAAAEVSVRTLQRLFGEYVGASPAWVIRRWRLIEAAERTSTDPGTDDPGSAPPVTWTEVAADLGYSDQSHLVREFRAHLGVTPGAYAAGHSG